MEISNDVYRPILAESDKNFYRNDWTVLGFRAFKLLKRVIPKRASMCIVGTGGGLDALGAIEILNPKSLDVSDLSDAALNLSLSNIFANLKIEAKQNITVEMHRSFLFQNFKVKSERFDFIFENLPNLPMSRTTKIVPSNQPVTASYYQRKEVGSANVPKVYSDHLLTLHWLFLNGAKQYLKKGGRVMCSIGGRIDYTIIEEMFREAGFEPHLLVYDFKRQNEAASNLPGYAEEERKRNNLVTYRYYEYEKVMRQLERNKHHNLGGFANDPSILKSVLSHQELSAQQANQLFVRDQTDMGHEVYFISGKLIDH